MKTKSSVVRKAAKRAGVKVQMYEPKIKITPASVLVDVRTGKITYIQYKKEVNRG